MKQPKNKFIAVCVYFAPYVCAVLSIVIYGVLVNVFRLAITSELLTEQPLLSTLLTYLPISIGFIVVAINVSKFIRTKWDLSAIGIAPITDKRRLSFFVIALVIACTFLSIGFASSYSYVEKRMVGGSDSYYIVDVGFMGTNKTETVFSKATYMEFDGETYTIKLSNGKEYKVKKNSKSGKIISDIYNV